MLNRQSVRTLILDADHVRQGLCSDLGYSLEDRKENIRRLAHTASLVSTSGMVVLVAAITPTATMRKMVRNIIPDLVEVYVKAPLRVCEARDVKGLYRRARAGELRGLTGIDSPYEPPEAPHVTCRTAQETEVESAGRVLEALSLGTNQSKERSCERRPTIAVDFDGVIAEYDGWKGSDVLGQPRMDVITALETLRREGWKLIIHTTRANNIVGPYLKQYRVPYDEINCNSDYVTGSTKPVATIYWDDRAFRYSGNAAADLLEMRQILTWSGRR
jgi:adenylylsulfate kinase